jgi:hypothetical protein
MAEKKVKDAPTVIIPPLKMGRANFTIRGTSPYVQNAFWNKGEMIAQQEAGSTAKKGKKKEPKDFDKCCENATHRSAEGWIGLPANAFRGGLIDACRMTGYQMVRAKLSVFVVAHGVDPRDGTPLIPFTKGKPRRADHPCRVGIGKMDVRARPMWDPGWETVVTVEWDLDQFTVEDVSNLFFRVGKQVGIGEGRASSKMSAGMGWGHFDIVGVEMQK